MFGLTLEEEIEQWKWVYEHPVEWSDLKYPTYGKHWFLNRGDMYEWIIGQAHVEGRKKEARLHEGLSALGTVPIVVDRCLRKEQWCLMNSPMLHLKVSGELWDEIKSLGPTFTAEQFRECFERVGAVEVFRNTIDDNKVVSFHEEPRHPAEPGNESNNPKEGK